MSEGVLIALITSVGTFLGVIISNFSSNKKLVNDIKLEITSYHASTDEKIKELTREVREHNNFAKRMPVVEKGIENLEEKVNYFHKV
jgi:polyhydroxyalkanoate synthesis regulator phasin